MAGLAAVLLTPIGVWAYFTSTGSGSAGANVSTLSVPASPTATASGGGVTVTWGASTIGGTVAAATSYTVERYDGGGTYIAAALCSPVPSTLGVPNAFGSFSCADSPGPGTFKYKITALYNTSWTATSGFTNSVSPATATSTATATATATSTATPTPAKQTPTVVTQIHNASETPVTTVTAGTSVHDKATVTGTSGTPTGTVTFTWYTASSACTGASVGAGTVTLDGSGVAHPSSTETPTAAGSYSFKAHYNGNTNYAEADSACESLTVTAGTAASLTLAAATTAPTEGSADNLTITAKDSYGNTATGYTGSHNLTFGGAATAPDGTHPTVTNSSGTAINFGSTTVISFTNGVANVSSGNNGVMKLYKAETVNITVTDGSITNGAGLSVTVSPGTATKLAWNSVSNSGGILTGICLFTCTYTGGSGGGITFRAKIAVTDDWGNTVSDIGSIVTVTVTKSPATGNSFTGSSTVTIPATGPAVSSGGGDGIVAGRITFNSRSGSWTTDTLDMTNTGGYAHATASFSK
jgi:hypothetical protein